jgi:hypothetical protein
MEGQLSCRRILYFNVSFRLFVWCGGLGRAATPRSTTLPPSRPCEVAAAGSWDPLAHAATTDALLALLQSPIQRLHGMADHVRHFAFVVPKATLTLTL